jgi:hypothetical protein
MKYAGVERKFARISGKSDPLLIEIKLKRQNVMLFVLTNISGPACIVK